MYFLFFIVILTFTKSLPCSVCTGTVEEFIISRTLELGDLHNPFIRDKVAAKLAKFHSTKVVSAVQSAAGESFHSRELRRYAATLAAASVGHEDDELTSGLLAQVVPVLALVNSISDDLVFCHNDLLPGNILEEPSGELMFIDFEYR